MPRYASIDIGTNTLRLYIAEVGKDGDVSPLLYKRTITRLGGNYDPAIGMDSGAMERTLSALAAFKAEIDAYDAIKTFATATSVVRRSANKGKFIEDVRAKTGIEVDIITGDEEARLSLLGVLSVLDTKVQRRFVFDIGGGSTEFIAAEVNSLVGAWSLEMGVVHLTENYLRTDPPKRTSVLALEENIRVTIDELKAQMEVRGVNPSDYTTGKAVMVGTAGTITTLASVYQNLEVYDRAKINNFVLTRDAIRGIYGRLIGMTLKERSDILSLEKGREDLIVPGSAIALMAMEAFGFDDLIVSDAGLLEGILIDRAVNSGYAARVKQ